MCAVPRLQQLLARRQDTVDAVRTLCARCYWQIDILRHISRRPNSAITDFLNAVTLPFDVTWC